MNAQNADIRGTARSERYRSPKVSIPVDDVYVSLEEFETEDLVKELKHRNQIEEQKKVPFEDELTEAYRLIQARRYDDAANLLERLLWPKWCALERCVEAFASTRKATGASK